MSGTAFFSQSDLRLDVKIPTGRREHQAQGDNRGANEHQNSPYQLEPPHAVGRIAE